MQANLQTMMQVGSDTQKGEGEGRKAGLQESHMVVQLCEDLGQGVRSSQAKSAPHHRGILYWAEISLLSSVTG